MKILSFRCSRVLICGVVVASALACEQAKPASPDPSAADKEIAALKADVQTLKDKAASASVAMADVGFHATNLWFAGRAQNWPLTTFYYNETRNHIRWMIRINPTPKGPDGEPVDLKGIFDALDTSTFADVKAAIDAKDSAKFPVVYKAMLVSCYSCHKSVGRPYLRLQIPTTVPQTIINMDTKATWPE